MKLALGTVILLALAYIIEEPIKARYKALSILLGIFIPLILVLLYSMAMMGIQAPDNFDIYYTENSMLTKEQLDNIRPTFYTRWGTSTGVTLSYTLIGVVLFIIIFIRGQFIKFANANASEKEENTDQINETDRE